MGSTLKILFALSLALAPAAANAFSCPPWLMRVLAGVVGKPDPLSARLKEAGDPYETAFDVGEPALREFQKILEANAKPRDRAARLAAWADTPDRALYLYQNLSDLKNHAAETLSYLLKESPQFANAMRSKDSDSLITFAFEKESDARLTRFYRPPDFNEDTWLQVDDKTRSPITGKYLLYPKHKAPATRLAPTREKPAALGGLQREVFGKESYEVAHKSYEFDHKRMFQQLGEVTTKLGETNGIHVHVVFELPENYPLDKFSAWVKDVNDHYQLEGMTRGIFPAKYKQIPEVAPAPPGRFRWPFSVAKDLPTKLSEITWRRFKRFAIGVRAGGYGPASRPGYVKIGLELRDASRNLELLEAYTRDIATMARERVWEKRPDKAAVDELPLTNEIHPDFRRTVQSSGVSPEMTEKLLTLVPFLSIPMRDYENSAVFDYVTGAYWRKSAADKKRIAHAREVFLTNLKGIQDRADYFAAEGKPWDDERVKMETLTVLGYWAQYANLRGTR